MCYGKQEDDWKCQADAWINQGLVLELIKQQGPISRTAIAKRLNLALPTVMRIVDQLLNEGLIIAEGLGDSSGGAAPVLFNINPQSRYLIGVDVKRRLTVILADLMGNKLHRRRSPYRIYRGTRGCD